MASDFGTFSVLNNFHDYCKFLSNEFFFEFSIAFRKVFCFRIILPKGTKKESSTLITISSYLIIRSVSFKLFFHLLLNWICLFSYINDLQRISPLNINILMEKYIKEITFFENTHFGKCF